MARSRTIRPEFWSDEKLASVSRESRLTYAGLWGTSDDYGVTKGNAAWLKSQIYPYDEDLKLSKFTEWLTELEKLGRIVPFTQDGEKFYYIPKFMDHQKVDRPSKTRNPEPPLDIGSRNTRECDASASRESSDETDTDTDTETDTYTGRDKAPSVPCDGIVGLFNEILGEWMPECKLTQERRKVIMQRWKSDKSVQSLEWWRTYFDVAANSDFLTGRNGRWTSCNIDWLLKKGNFQKVREGTYSNREAA